MSNIVVKITIPKKIVIAIITSTTAVTTAALSQAIIQNVSKNNISTKNQPSIANKSSLKEKNENQKLNKEKQCKSLIKNLNTNFWSEREIRIKRVNCEEFGITTINEKFRTRSINFKIIRRDLNTVPSQAKNNAVHFWKKVKDLKPSETEQEALKYYCSNFPKKRFTYKEGNWTPEERNFLKFCLNQFVQAKK